MVTCDVCTEPCPSPLRLLLLLPPKPCPMISSAELMFNDPAPASLTPQKVDPLQDSVSSTMTLEELSDNTIDSISGGTVVIEIVG